MSSNKLYLVCNAHLDPVWLWEWEEGLAETLSTFRTAAEFCEKYEEFVFCHNESLLYMWVEEYDPDLFKRIKKLVQKGLWRIIGGWYLQPDCNLPSGESFVRQILTGKNYFKDKFGTEPQTAVNFDPFGHSKGLVQILKKSGYNSYLFCRPDNKFMDIESDDFIWKGYDGSEILAHRAGEHYNSERGKAGERILEWIEKNRNKEYGILLWGIGNHGGGPSREDLNDIRELKESEDNFEILHSYPEEYFRRAGGQSGKYIKVDSGLNPWAIGCYTSMALVKQKHRQLENEYFKTEKILVNASIQNLISYPKESLRQALEDLLFGEFHDILPGSAIPEVESYAVQRFDHGLEILRKLRSKVFFKLIEEFEPAKNDEYPLFVLNHHPFDIEETIICEFQAPEPNFNTEVFWMPEIFDMDGESVEFQLEKESSNIQNDHRKRVVFRVPLRASSMNRFSCYLREVPSNSINNSGIEREFEFKNDLCEISIDRNTGYIKSYKVNGYDYLNDGSFRFLVIDDDADPWGMNVISFRNKCGEFTLMSPEEAASFSAVDCDRLDPVRVIEKGPVRTVVEALFKFKSSAVCLRYIIPAKGSEVEIRTRVLWLENDKMLKLSIPTVFKQGSCLGQDAYGVKSFESSGEEYVAQKWLASVSEERSKALTIINDSTYGFDFKDGELRLSLLRSPAYSGHPVMGEAQIVPQDRFEPRIDHGERTFSFWLNAGSYNERMNSIDREAGVKNEGLSCLCCFPSSYRQIIRQGINITDDVLQITALKMSERQNHLIIRIFEPTGNNIDTVLNIPALDLKINLNMKSFELKTLAVDISSGKYFETDLLENKIEI